MKTSPNDLLIYSDTEYYQNICTWFNEGSKSTIPHINLDQGVFIYGAGDLGRLAIDYCEACQIRIAGVLDRSRAGSIRSKDGRIYTISTADSHKDSHYKNVPVAVAISTSPYTPIKDCLNDFGWGKVIPFYDLTAKVRQGHPLQNGWKLGAVNESEREMVRELINSWSDDVSRKHYLSFIAWHSNNSELIFDDCPIDPNERYLIPELIEALEGRRRQFVDVGSHRAESIRRLNSKKIFFEDYILFEPDEHSVSYLQPNKMDFIPERSTAQIIAKVLGDAERIANFKQGLGYCSQLSNTGSIKKDVVTLDSFGLKPDFIKVHIEGEESQVLRGAERTILTHRPCIAYSVYHRREGFFRDIYEPMCMIPEYKWYFRMHGYQGTGAFVYGIPE